MVVEWKICSGKKTIYGDDPENATTGCSQKQADACSNFD